MKHIQRYTLVVFTLFCSCTQSGPSTVEFEGEIFELPIKVYQAKGKLGLQYGYYAGFYRGNINDKEVFTQLDDYPAFMGSDNDKEERYYDNYFVGISFFKADKSIEQLKAEFEKKYNRVFKSHTKDFGPTRTLPPFNMTYHYIKTADDLFITLKEVERKTIKKKYVAVSFYKGISGNDLANYVAYIH
jgi:hypothetical protein